ncbi:hypothetical protein JOQ06_018338, partial [Pogonophryne albipinna]
ESHSAPAILPDPDPLSSAYTETSSDSFSIKEHNPLVLKQCGEHEEAQARRY